MRARIALVALVALVAGCNPVVPTSRFFSFVEATTIGGTVQQRVPNCIEISFDQTFPTSIVTDVTSTVTVSSVGPSVSVTTQASSGESATQEWTAEDLEAKTLHRITMPLGDGVIYTFTGRETGQLCSL